MFDLVQIKSLFKRKNFKEDMEYIEDLTDEVVHEDCTNTDFNIDRELNELKDLDHEHENSSLINSITEEDIQNWNNKSLNAKTKTSEYENDTSYINIDELNLILKNSISNSNNLKVVYYEYDNLVINSLTGEKVIICIDNDGAIITKNYYE